MLSCFVCHCRVFNQVESAFIRVWTLFPLTKYQCPQLKCQLPCPFSLCRYLQHSYQLLNQSFQLRNCCFCCLMGVESYRSHQIAQVNFFQFHFEISFPPYFHCFKVYGLTQGLTAFLEFAKLLWFRLSCYGRASSVGRWKEKFSVLVKKPCTRLVYHLDAIG